MDQAIAPIRSTSPEKAVMHLNLNCEERRSRRVHWSARSILPGAPNSGLYCSGSRKRLCVAAATNNGLIRFGQW